MATQTAVRRQEQPTEMTEQARRPVYVPAVDIVEQPDGLLMMLDMPGVDSENVEIKYENGTLTVHGKVDRPGPQQGGWLVREYGTGDYHRVFAVGEGIEIDRIEARCKDGVLHLHLPKAETLKPRRIAVKS